MTKNLTIPIDCYNPVELSEEFVKQNYPDFYKSYINLPRPLNKNEIAIKKSKHNIDIRREYIYKGMKFTVSPSVHLPGEGSKMIYDYLKEVNGDNKSIVVMGAGCGVETVISADRKFKKIFAVDNNPESVECTSYNYNNLVEESNRRRIDFIPLISDLFDKLPEGTMTDIIVFNPPSTHIKISNNNQVIRNICVGTSIVTCFLRQITEKNLLKPEGEAIVVISNTTELKKIVGFSLLIGLEPYEINVIKNLTTDDNKIRYLMRFITA